MNTITAHLEEDTIQRLSKLSEAMRRPQSWLVAEAVRRYLNEEERILSDIHEGIKEADDGNFATPEEVKVSFAKWGVDAR